MPKKCLSTTLSVICPFKQELLLSTVHFLAFCDVTKSTFIDTVYKFSMIFQNKSTHPGLHDKVFLVFCKSLSQMINNLYRDFILIYEFLIKITLWLYLL